MRYLIDNRNHTDPAVNLALEEHCLKNLEDGHQYVRLYCNEPSVVVGRNQNILQEIDSRFIEDHRMPVVRRLSGGGAVYHDRGNLKFGFIQKAGNGRNHVCNIFQKACRRRVKRREGGEKDA